MTEIVGNLIGSEFPDKIYLARNEGVEILLGDILKIIDFQNPNQEFLIRISGATQPTSNDAEMISRRLLRDPHFSNIIKARGSRDIYQGILLCTFRKTRKGEKHPYIPKNLPSRHSTVIFPEKSDLSFIDNLKHKGYDLPIGVLRVRGDYQPTVYLRGADLPRHIGVYAITGKGKTGFTKVLLYQIASNIEQKYSGLVFDAHDEYYTTLDPSLRGLRDANLSNLHYYDLHDPKTTKISASSITPSDFRMVYQDTLTPPQQDALQLLYTEYFDQWLPTITSMTPEALIEFSKSSNVKISSLKVVQRRARLLLDQAIFTKASITKDFIRETLDNLDQGSVCIINTRVLSNMEERALLSILTTKLLSRRKKLLDEKNGSKLLAEKPVILLVVEEALSVLGTSVLKRGSNIFADLTREGRKYKIGLLPVVQIPHRLDPDVASNINTNVILGLAQSRSRQAVAENALDDMDPLISEMKMLDVGEALISYPHKGEIPFPLPVQITYFNDLLDDIEKRPKAKKTVNKHLS